MSVDPALNPPADDDAWTKDPEALERVFRAAVAASDVRGVEAALTLMACVDPGRAQRLFTDLELALHLASVLDGLGFPRDDRH